MKTIHNKRFTDEEIRRRCPDCGKCHDCQWEKDVSILWKLLLDRWTEAERALVKILDR